MVQKQKKILSLEEVKTRTDGWESAPVQTETWCVDVRPPKPIFRFIAGEQHIAIQSRTLLDAWNALTIKAKQQPLPIEFSRQVITAYDTEGTVLGARSWIKWQELLWEDTYGPNWREIMDHADSLRKGE